VPFSDFAQEYFHDMGTLLVIYLAPSGLLPDLRFPGFVDVVWHEPPPSNVVDGSKHYSNMIGQLPCVCVSFAFPVL